MPCSYQQGDGIRCDVEASGQTKDEASEHACLRVLAHILAENYASVRLIPKHWNIPLTELHERVDDVLSRRASHQPLAYEEPGDGQTPSGAEVAASERCSAGAAAAESSGSVAAESVLRKMPSLINQMD